MLHNGIMYPVEWGLFIAFLVLLCISVQRGRKARQAGDATERAFYRRMSRVYGYLALCVFTVPQVRTGGLLPSLALLLALCYLAAAFFHRLRDRRAGAR
jgi:hypothetical protein